MHATRIQTYNELTNETSLSEKVPDLVNSFGIKYEIVDKVADTNRNEEKTWLRVQSD